MTTMAAVGAFVLVIAAVAVFVARDGRSSTALPKLSFGAAGSSATTALPSTAGSPAAGERAALAPYGSLTYEVRGTLPALGGTAPAFTVEPDASRARINALAAALGVPADRVMVLPDAQPKASSGTVLVVMRDAWSLQTMSPACSTSSAGVTVCTSSGTASSGTASSGTASSGTASSGSSGASTGAARPATTSGDTGQTTVAPDCPMPPCPAGAACAQVCPAPSPDPAAPATTIPAQPPAAPVRPADLPSRADAERIGRSVLAKAGVDLDGADVRVDDQTTAWSVTITPTAGGLPARGLETILTIGPKGAVVAGYGRLVKLTKVGDYPLAGSAEGLARLKAGRFAGPVPMLGAGTPANGSAAAVVPELTGPTATAPTDARQPAPPDAVEPVPPVTGTAVPAVPPVPPVTALPPAPNVPPPPDPATPRPIVVTVTGVHLALASSFTTTGGRETLAPVYVFETEAHGELLPVPAVTDALLDTAPVTTPEPSSPSEPAPATKPADGTPGSAPAVTPSSAP